MVPKKCFFFLLVYPPLAYISSAIYTVHCNPVVIILSLRNALLRTIIVSGLTFNLCAGMDPVLKRQSSKC